MNVKELVIKQLKSDGYDGLFDSEYECACLIDDIMPCDEFSSQRCEAGYKTECNGELDGCPCSFHLGPSKP